MKSHFTHLQRRAKVLKAIRAFFDEQDFIEVDTPVALTTVAPEVHIEAPRVVLNADGPQTRYLQTSPELPMKRLLAQGAPLIYQIAPAFRDGDISPLHRPEFRILEWYRKDTGWQTLLGDCEGLIRSSAKALGIEELNYAGQVIPITEPFPRISVEQAFEKYARFSILESLEMGVLQEHLVRLEIHHDPSDSWDDLYHRVFLTRVEPKLLEDYPVFFLTDYPAPLAALSRLNPQDARSAERFELFLGGLEIANGYGELCDPIEQRRRFEVDSKTRAGLGVQVYPNDERFIAALDNIESAAGIALGVERLLMVLFDVSDIDGVLALPWATT